MSKQKSLIAVAPLFLALFIDSMGLGILYPILNTIILDPSTSILGLHTSDHLRNFLYGSLISVFMLCWFFGAAVLGDLSDSIGRKKALVISLFGGCVGYLLSAVAVVFHSFSLLMLGRIIAGFTSGSQAVAQAAIIDISEPQHKARNIGYILLAVSLGFIFGPLISGILSYGKLVSWFSPSLPLYFAGFISLFNAIFLQMSFRETFITVPKKVQIKFSHAINLFASAFKNPKVRILSIIFLLMMLGWSSFFSYVSMYLLRTFHYSPFQVGLYVAAEGLGFGLGFTYLVGYCEKHFDMRKTVAVSAAVTAFFVLLTVLSNSLWGVWLSVIPLTLGMSVAYSIIITIFSHQVDAKSQGWIMGITGSIMALSFAIMNLLGAVFVDLSITAPIIVAFVLLAMSAVAMKAYQLRAT